MAVTPELVATLRRHIGDSSPPVTTTVDRLTSQRYARAIGDDNPLYFDEEFARDCGYPGLLVPPNFLPAYLDWTDGGPEEELRVDGTVAADISWIPLQGVRLMGGGEEMIFHRPVCVGTEVRLVSRLDDVSARESRSGPMVIIKLCNSYTTIEGTPLVTSVRTVLGR